ncbi:hypothetical protein LA02_1811 [Francisella philomiragia]|uniref:hypothetical protein n=1 Tax=Francisella philomiragia TaxID=28110 RepID=UPI0005A57C0C|nr:hypothetical protein [Francisella philomiragia]AJI56522.1 hypothetical protein LA02_1811 [Francisella philomiragia]
MKNMKNKIVCALSIMVSGVIPAMATSIDNYTVITNQKGSNTMVHAYNSESSHTHNMIPWDNIDNWGWTGKNIGKYNELIVNDGQIDTLTMGHYIENYDNSYYWGVVGGGISAFILSGIVNSLSVYNKNVSLASIAQLKDMVWEIVEYYSDEFRNPTRFVNKMREYGVTVEVTEVVDNQPWKFNMTYDNKKYFFDVAKDDFNLPFDYTEAGRLGRNVQSVGIRMTELMTAYARSVNVNIALELILAAFTIGFAVTDTENHAAYLDNEIWIGNKDAQNGDSSFYKAFKQNVFLANNTKRQSVELSYKNNNNQWVQWYKNEVLDFWKKTVLLNFTDVVNKNKVYQQQYVLNGLLFIPKELDGNDRSNGNVLLDSLSVGIANNSIQLKFATETDRKKFDDLCYINNEENITKNKDIMASIFDNKTNEYISENKTNEYIFEGYLNYSDWTNRVLIPHKDQIIKCLNAINHDIKFSMYDIDQEKAFETNLYEFGIIMDSGKYTVYPGTDKNPERVSSYEPMYLYNTYTKS